MAALLTSLGTAATAIGQSGLGSVLGNAMGGAGSVGGILGQLVGSSIQGDVDKDTGGMLGNFSSGLLGGDPNASTNQTGAAAGAQAALAPQSLSSDNSNQYSATPYNQQFNPISSNASPFSSQISKLLGL